MKKSLFFFVAVATIMTVDAKPKRKKQPSKKTTTEHVDDFALLDAAIKKNKETLAKNPHVVEEKKEAEKLSRKERKQIIAAKNEEKLQAAYQEADRLIQTLGPKDPATIEQMKACRRLALQYDHNVQRGVKVQKHYRPNDIIRESIGTNHFKQ